MKKTILKVAFLVFVSGIVMTSCMSSAEKVEASADKVEGAQQDLDQAQREYDEQYAEFKMES